MISTKKTIYKITEAISSIKSSISTITTGIGTLANLTTTSKIVVGAINEVDGDLSTLTTTVNNTVHITESGTVTSPATSTTATPPDDHNGASGTWTYRKWSDGTTEAWCQSAPKTITPSDWVSWDELVSAEVVPLGINYPSGLFVSAPQVTATAMPTSGYTLISAEMSIAGSTDLSKQTPRVWGVRANAAGANIVAVANFYCVGKWQ